MIHQPLRIVLVTLKNLVYHHRQNVLLVHQAIEDSHWSNSRELVDITSSIIITIRSRVPYLCVWNSVLPQLGNPCKCLALRILYAQFLSDYCMVCSCEIELCPTDFGCSYKHRGICQILEFDLHFCVLIVAHFCKHEENIQIVRKTLCEQTISSDELGLAAETIAPHFEEEDMYVARCF